MMLIEDIVMIYENYPDLETEVLAASIRHPQHLLAAAKAGCPCGDDPTERDPPALFPSADR